MINLNKNQKAAMEHKDGPMMVLAGPGSGKTTVITYRVNNLIENYKIDPYNILVISFTKASAEEMKKRYGNLFNISNSKTNFSTFHSFFFRVINKALNYDLKNVINSIEKNEVLKKIIKSENIETKDQETLLQDISNELSLVINDLRDINSYESVSIGTIEFKSILQKYNDYKEHYNKIDFDDMLYKCFKILSNDKNSLEYWQNRYKYILIDEFQDINKIQFETIKLISKPLNNLFIVGDDDQSIYKFRGARPEFLLDFPDFYPDVKKVVLNINHRSTREIIRVCNKVISQNEKRYEKDVKGTKKNGEIPTVILSKDVSSEAMNIGNRIKKLSEKYNYSDIAVIYRNNIHARAFVDAFRNFNIPYSLKDEMPIIYNHWISKDIVAYMKLACDTNDSNSLIRIINKPNRFFSKDVIARHKYNSDNLFEELLMSDNLKKRHLTRLEELLYQLVKIKKSTPQESIKYIRKIIGYDNHLQDFASYIKISPKGLFEIINDLEESSKSFNTNLDYIDHINNVISDEKNRKHKKSHIDGVTLSTFHSIKGLEFDNVFVTSVNEDIIPFEKSFTKEDIEEECRLLYVGMTRARQNLFLSLLKTRYETKIEPSRFLNKILKIG